MFGDKRSRNVRLTRANLKTVSPDPLNPPWRRVDSPSSARFCSTHRSSRIRRNLLKTRLRCHRYPSHFKDSERPLMRLRQIDSAGRRG